MKNNTTKYSVFLAVILLCCSTLTGCSSSYSSKNTNNNDESTQLSARASTNAVSDKQEKENYGIGDNISDAPFEISQSSTPVPSPEEGYCYLESEDGDILGELLIPNDYARVEISRGGSSIHLIKEYDELDVEKAYIFFDGVLEYDINGFFPHNLNSEYGDGFEKRYLANDDIYEINESEQKTTQLNDVVMWFKETSYVQHNDNCLELDGYIKLNGEYIAIHSKGIDKEEAFEILQSIKSKYYACPNVRNDTVFTENDDGIESYTFPIPSVVEDFYISEGGCFAHWEVDENYYTVEASNLGTVAEEKAILEEIEIRHPKWEKHTGKYLEYDYAKGNQVYDSETQELVALTEHNNNIVVAKVECGTPYNKDIEKDFFELLDKIQPLDNVAITRQYVQQNASNNSEESEDLGQLEFPLIPIDGYCYIDDVEGHKLGQIRIPDNLTEVNITGGGLSIEFIINQYQYLNLNSNRISSPEELDLVSDGTDGMEGAEKKSDKINDMKVFWKKAGSKISGIIEVSGKWVTFDSCGFDEDKVFSILQTIKEEYIPCPNIRNNTLYLENAAGTEILMLPLENECKRQIVVVCF